MIRDLTVENFRGFEKLAVEGLGRVNLIVGRNDSGKTSLMGAAAIATGPLALVSWGRYLAHPSTAWDDVERVWRPLFRGGVPDVPIQITGVDDEGAFSVDVALSQNRLRAGYGFPASWVGTRANREPASEVYAIQSAAGLCEIGPGVPPRPGWWSGSSPDAEHDLLTPLTGLYTSGRIGDVAAMVGAIIPGLASIAVVGSAIYVTVAGSALPLPLSVLGDGSRRLVEFAVAIVQGSGKVYIDEIENGLHWSVLPAVWDLLRTAKVDQLFATTHREENVRIACERFVAAGDDGLRIVRIDRDDTKHRAVVYAPEEALAALEAGLEVRG